MSDNRTPLAGEAFVHIIADHSRLVCEQKAAQSRLRAFGAASGSSGSPAMPSVDDVWAEAESTGFVKTEYKAFGSFNPADFKQFGSFEVKELQ